MPEGYQCDMCGEFDKHTHNSTEIDFGWIEVGETALSPSKIICPDCGEDVYQFVTPEGGE